MYRCSRTLRLLIVYRLSLINQSINQSINIRLLKGITERRPKNINQIRYLESSGMTCENGTIRTLQRVAMYAKVTMTYYKCYSLTGNQNVQVAAANV